MAQKARKWAMTDRADHIGTCESLKQFVAAINHHDLDAVVAMLTADHLFVDSAGNRTQGASAMQAGWRGYFEMCPDYWIRADHVIAEGELVLAVGEAGGTIDGVPWSTPAAWKARVREGKLAEWRVYADIRPVLDILSKRQQ
jgi:ketosteroid isomerase-like protein